MKHLERIAYILVLIAAAAWLFSPQLAAWGMAAGALGLLITHLSERYEGSDLRQRRNNRTRHILPLFYIATAYFMFRPGMNWLPCLCIAVALEAYTLWVGRD